MRLWRFVSDEQRQLLLIRPLAQGHKLWFYCPETWIQQHQVMGSTERPPGSKFTLKTTEVSKHLTGASGGGFKAGNIPTFNNYYYYYLWSMDNTAQVSQGELWSFSPTIINLIFKLYEPLTGISYKCLPVSIFTQSASLRHNVWTLSRLQPEKNVELFMRRLSAFTASCELHVYTHTHTHIQRVVCQLK